MENEKLPGAYVADGYLFFKLLDGSTIDCRCIGAPYAEQVVDLFKAQRNLGRDGMLQAAVMMSGMVECINGCDGAERITTVFRDLC